MKIVLVNIESFDFSPYKNIFFIIVHTNILHFAFDPYYFVLSLENWFIMEFGPCNMPSKYYRD
jgi:hypothetical protein